MKWHPTGPTGIKLRTATMTEVFQKANREATYGRDCKVDNLLADPSVRWCFQSGDNNTPDWYPQGVSSDSDAEADGGWNGQNGVMVSWYHKPGDKGARITLLNTNTKKYRHLLLVVPDGKGSYGPVNVHAGGIVWYGHRLYVADTYEGTRVFDLRNIWDLTADPNGNTDDGTRIGRHGDTYYAHSYRYAVPQLGRWRSPKRADEKECTTTGPIRNSWMSLDRASSPNRLVIGEFCSAAEHDTPGRVTAWNLRGEDIAHTDRVATADGVDHLPAINGKGAGANVQGGATTGDANWYFSVSRGKSKAGHLYWYQHRRELDGSWFWERVARKTTPRGPEDLTFRYRKSKKLLYSVSEYPGSRVIYARDSNSGW